MLVVVAPDAEVFPVAAVGGIVEVIAILMMDGEKVEIAGLEFPPAFSANPTMKL